MQEIFTREISELTVFKNSYILMSRRLFELEKNCEEKLFSQQERSDIAMHILLIRHRTRWLIYWIFKKLPDEDLASSKESDDLSKMFEEEFAIDDELQGALIEDLIVGKNNILPIAFISRYQNIIYLILDFCHTPKTENLYQEIRSIHYSDYVR